MDYRFNHFRRQHLLDDLQFHAGPAPGRPVPDFDLPVVTGGVVRKSDHMGSRPALLTFASLTDPISASAAPVLKRLHRRFGESVSFITVYVREAHPGQHIPQAEALEQKMRYASALRARDDIPWAVAVDDLDGAFHRAMGGNSSAAYLMDRSGDVAFRTLWSNDEGGLRRALEAIASGSPGRPCERARRVVPLARGLPRVDEVVRAAGPDAIAGFRRETPLLFAAAELAWVWRALTPRGRIAVAVACAAGVLGVYGAMRLMARPARAR